MGVLILSVSVSGNVTCTITGGVSATLTDGQSGNYTGGSAAYLSASGDFDHWRFDGTNYYTSSITVNADDGVHNVVLYGGSGGGGGDDPTPTTPTFDAWVYADSSDGTKLYYGGEFTGGDSSYTYKRKLVLSINGSVYDDGNESYNTGGANSYFNDKTVTGLTAGTTYNWRVTLYVRVSGGWSATSYYVTGQVTTAGGATGNGYVNIYSGGSWHKAVPYIYSGGSWHQAVPYIYSGGSWHQGG